MRTGWLARISPDIESTARRFPLAIAMAAAATAIFICFTNGVAFVRDEAWQRAFFGLATGAVLAVAGVYFAESRPRALIAKLLVGWVLPLAAAASFEITAVDVFVPYALPVVAVMWLSVSPVVHVGHSDAERLEQQNRFWWVNHLAVETALIAAAAVLIVCLGLMAIAGAMHLLFGIGVEDYVYRWMLPIAAFFLAPVYWLSTLPRMADYQPGALDRPEFTSRAVGLLGQFVLVPLLLIYGLILIAYAAQIVATQSIPQGIIGWMVPGFTIVGAATWLVLHPGFLRDRPLVRFFHRWWFWLTLVPLVLFFVAVRVRVDAYGFTPQRILLAIGGVWATLLSAAFLLRRGDIRLIPAVAGGLLLIVSIGPWNYASLPTSDQLGRLDRLVGIGVARWTEADVESARGALDYLIGDSDRAIRLASMLATHDIAYHPGEDSAAAILASLGYAPPDAPDEQLFHTFHRDPVQAAVDVSATPVYLGAVTLYGTTPTQGPGLQLALDGRTLVYSASGRPDESGRLSLGDWIDRQGGDAVVDPAVDLMASGATYRLVIDELELVQAGNAPEEISRISGTLFADRPPAIR